MSLDTVLVSEAKKSFLQEYLPKIEQLGYNLACGITRIDSSFAICANVYYSGTTADNVLSQTKEFLPKEYHYKGFRVPVDIRICETPKLF